MRSLARCAAPLAFFVLAIVGWLSGVPVFVCGIRALIGSVVIYVLLGSAARLVADVVADAAVRDASQGLQRKDASGERGSQ